MDRLGGRLNKLRVPTLLTLDEMGYTPRPARHQLSLSTRVRRYTKGSIIITSNKSYPEWGSVFGDEFAGVAIIDRLLHYSTTVNIRGESYRLKDEKRHFTVPPTLAAEPEPQVEEFQTGAQTKSVLSWGLSDRP
jgi:DNA replication protein DnaC